MSNNIPPQDQQTQNNDNQNNDGNSSPSLQSQFDAGLEIQVEISAREGFQNTGLKVEAGDEILVKADGRWGGGQRSFGLGTENYASELNCGPEGCNGETANTYFEDYPADNINIRTLQVDIEDATGLSEQYCGYRNGSFDGQTICFAADNRFLGDNTPGVQSDGGYWSEQRLFWNTQKVFLEANRSVLQSYSVDSSALSTMNIHIDAVTKIMDIYRLASCDSPPSFDDLVLQFERIRDLQLPGLNLALTYYPITYKVDVPENNYRKCCHQDDIAIIEDYHHGVPSVFVEKNECLEEAALSSLSMKIVPKGEDLSEQRPVLVSNLYENNKLLIGAEGFIHFGNNDLTRGRGDNKGSLRIRIQKQTSTNSE